jgi:hypothetical protein
MCSKKCARPENLGDYRRAVDGNHNHRQAILQCELKDAGILGMGRYTKNHPNVQGGGKPGPQA